METLMSRITGKMKLDTLALILGVFFLLVLLVISSINRAHHQRQNRYG